MLQIFFLTLCLGFIRDLMYHMIFLDKSEKKGETDQIFTNKLKYHTEQSVLIFVILVQCRIWYWKSGHRLWGYREPGRLFHICSHGYHLTFFSVTANCFCMIFIHSKDTSKSSAHIGASNPFSPVGLRHKMHQNPVCMYWMCPILLAKVNIYFIT